MVPRPGPISPGCWIDHQLADLGDPALVTWPMPVTAAAREVLQGHFGAATLREDPEKYLAGDFAALMETMALAGGMKLVSENKKVPTGLES